MGRIANITFAAAEPAALAEFWAKALAYEVQALPPELLESIVDEGGDPNAAAAIVDPYGRGPRLFFERKQKSATEILPIHLDLQPPDDVSREAFVAQLVDWGATRIEERSHTVAGHTATWTVMRDPEGNGFCVQ